ncbi:MAG: zinc ABC transporter substrate-binding protein, partial [Chlamydiia bacterium]|nr:zinc ABC transporter substrate-binding protein [Chlamydiia bacterium]
GKTIMVSHAALGYFCKDFDLKQVAVECEGKSPLPREVEQIIAFAKSHEIICLFTAPQFNNRGAEIIAKDLGIRIEKFDPLASNPLNTIELVAHTIAQ